MCAAAAQKRGGDASRWQAEACAEGVLPTYAWCCAGDLGGGCVCPFGCASCVWARGAPQALWLAALLSALCCAGGSLCQLLRCCRAKVAAAHLPLLSPCSCCVRCCPCGEQRRRCLWVATALVVLKHTQLPCMPRVHRFWCQLGAPPVCTCMCVAGWCGLLCVRSSRSRHWCVLAV